MAVTLNLMDRFRERFLDGNNTVDLEYSGAPAGAVLKLLLAVASGFTVNQNTNTTLSNVTYTEVTGTGYTAGGNALENASVTMDGSGLITVDADNPATWTQDAGGFSNARRALVAFDNGGAQSTWPVVAYSNDFGADQGNVAGDFSIQLSANGLFQSAR